MQGVGASPGTSGAQAMWGASAAVAATPPGSGGVAKMAGIGCNINLDDRGQLHIRKVIPGGPAAFSCQLAVEDILVSVDGVSVRGETPEEVARRIVGPEGFPITVHVLARSGLRGEGVVEQTVTMLRQGVVHMPDRLSEGNALGLGIELGRTPAGLLQVRRLQSEGAAALTGKLSVGDVLLQIDGSEVQNIPQNVDVSTLLCGPAYSRVSLIVSSNGVQRTLHMVRTVPLLGEYLMKYNTYQNALQHAIIQPSPPSRSNGNGVSARHNPMPSSVRNNNGSENNGTNHQNNFNRADVEHLDQRMQQVLSSEALLGALSDAGSPSLQALGANSAGGQASDISNRDSEESFSGTHDSSSLLSRSSTASRDSIAANVRAQFGEGVDSIRTTEGREATFSPLWPHHQNPRLSKGKMATAGFLFVPDSEATDKVMCVYCGLELGHWDENDDPWTAHHDAAPGCSFWRKSSTGSQRLSKDLFSGYGSPFHSLFRTAGAERTIV
mmetsp:Transcript_31235/g.48943  ORF Transcript_31235/g.48943 Transcript_31235/m.48943 type:complete len:496 (-) Transcript_31235:187-1674(-)